jgi:hypothetical protein
MNEGTKKARIIFGRITDFNNIQVLFLYLHSIKNGGI